MTRYSSTSSLHPVLPFTTEHNTLLLHLLSPSGPSFHNRTQHATPPPPLSARSFLSQQKTTRYPSTSSLHTVLPFTTEHDTLLLRLLSPLGPSFHNRTQHATPPPPLSTRSFLSRQNITRYSSASSLHPVLPFTTEHITLLLHLLSPSGPSFHNRT